MNEAMPLWLAQGQLLTSGIQVYWASNPDEILASSEGDYEKSVLLWLKARKYHCVVYHDDESKRLL